MSVDHREERGKSHERGKQDGGRAEDGLKDRLKVSGWTEAWTDVEAIPEMF